MSSRIDLRVEDILSIGFTLTLVAFVGLRSALTHLTLDETNFWDVSFLMTPVALLVFAASVRYFLGARLARGADALRDVGTVLRDWLPFLLFSLAYEGFRTGIWSVLGLADRDADLLQIDRMLVGETPAVFFDRLLNPVTTNAMSVLYFLHLVLPPLLAVLLYQRQKPLFREFLLAILVAGCIGSIGYVLVPATGPAVAFPDLFHYQLSGDVYTPVTGFLDAARAPRDAFPSLHVAISTVVLVYAARHRRRLAAVLLPFVIGNWASTIYLRYHYLIDVIAGWLVAGASLALARLLLSLESRMRR